MNSTAVQLALAAIDEYTGVLIDYTASWQRPTDRTPLLSVFSSVVIVSPSMRHPQLQHVATSPSICRAPTTYLSCHAFDSSTQQSTGPRTGSVPSRKNQWRSHVLRNPSDVVDTEFHPRTVSDSSLEHSHLPQEANDYALQFQLRFAPALANKPSAPRTDPAPGAPHKPFNPFANPEHGPLFITDLPPSHNLVLNKFAVVPEHFLLTTKQFKPQTHLLEPDDLAATYACIEAYHATGAEGGLYAFFNSGTLSGASQPHRHIQLLPVGRMKEGLEDPSAWDVLANRLVGPRPVETPFRTFARAISPEMTAEQLHATYMTLYRQAVEAMRDHSSLPRRDEVDEEARGEDGAEGAEGEPAQISYNMAMTRTAMVICPRRAEGATIVSSSGDLVGMLSLNGTVLAGTALVKSEAEWDAIRNDDDGRALADLLGKIGLPPAGSESQL